MAPVTAASSSSAFNRIGFWSPNTASVDWCENNYVVSYYIAEFWNTISNFGSLLLVILGYHLFPTNDGRFKVLFWTCGVVAIGSTLFHGTLRHKMQLLDELPMLYSATIILYILVEAKHGRQGSWFPVFLTTWLSLTTYIFSTTGGKLQFYTFQSTYTTLQLCMIYYLRLLHVQQRSKRPNPAVSVLIRRALLFGAFAVSIWLIDLRLCEFINGVGPKSVLRWNPQLHAWWHVFSAVAMYHAALLVGYYHYDVIGQRPIVYQWRGFLPALKLDVLSENHKTM
ncbi:ceramidase [Gamsiella multidivaricata]|uniref:ceramidase n=1 Tax=Gamsiella multidivaricata TaxID=101098 RepID=UPI00221F77A3|nr:ceramidase [Gamsiella multidivaricata]KAI7817822.1 ceramidase [Gamsiella multidivaricata]